LASRKDGDRILTRSSSVDSIHFLSSSIVHRLLLLLQLSNYFPDSHTIWYRTLIGLALTCVDLKESPDSLTNIASACCLLLTLSAVFQKTLHLRTVRRWTFLRSAGGCMKQKGHMKLNTSLTFLTLSFCELCLLTRYWDWFQWMWMSWCVRILYTILTLIEIGTGRAVEAVSLENFSRARHTLLHKFWCVTVV
jgi:hypothetical protein